MGIKDGFVTEWNSIIPYIWASSRGSHLRVVSPIGAFVESSDQRCRLIKRIKTNSERLRSMIKGQFLR